MNLDVPENGQSTFFFLSMGGAKPLIVIDASFMTETEVHTGASFFPTCFGHASGGRDEAKCYQSGGER